ncbi:4'-phosphopantetheinyl transferase family protein [Blastococcus sp. SYSU D01042]
MRQHRAVTGTTGPVVLVERPADVLGRWDPDVLSARERRRSRALRHPADRAGYTAAHLLARQCVAHLTGRGPHGVQLVQRCSACGSPEHGRPWVADLPEVHVSLAHTRGAVVAAADLRPVGVDVESLAGARVDDAAMSIALTPAETVRVEGARRPDVEFLRHWVRKESLVKAGLATLDTLTSVDPEPDSRDDGPRTSAWRGLHVVDWVDHRLGAVLAVAGSGVGSRTATCSLPTPVSA